MASEIKTHTQTKPIPSIWDITKNCYLVVNTENIYQSVGDAKMKQFIDVSHPAYRAAIDKVWGQVIQVEFSMPTTSSHIGRAIAQTANVKLKIIQGPTKKSTMRAVNTSKAIPINVDDVIDIEIPALAIASGFEQVEFWIHS